MCPIPLPLLVLFPFLFELASFIMKTGPWFPSSSRCSVISVIYKKIVFFVVFFVLFKCYQFQD